MRTVIIFCLCLFTFTVQAQDDVNYTYMDSLFQQLPEVLVKGERPVVKAERGKLIYDLPRMVERLPVNNAYEAVKELPGIVEQDGNLTLGGRGITVVINGKVSTLDKEDLRTVLENTPCQSFGESGNHVCCSGPLPDSWSHGECYSKIEYRAETCFVRRSGGYV